MLVSMKDILIDAHQGNYGVMAINCINMEMARGAINAAEEMNSSIIIQIGMGQMNKHAHPDEMIPLIVNLAKKSKMPVALHHDHGQKLDVIVDCIQRGFTSVMFDGSSLPFEENVKKTSVISKLAHQKNVCVEAELGHVGMADDNDNLKDDLYTDINLAKEFVQRTEVDCLAVAIGTAHGKYPEGYIPKLDFERLKTLKETLNIPLVLHGGSGSGEENLKKAVKYGINKINVCTDAFKVAAGAMLEAYNNGKDYLEMCMNAELAIKQFVMDYVKIIGSDNKYTFLDEVTYNHE